MNGKTLIIGTLALVAIAGISCSFSNTIYEADPAPGIIETARQTGQFNTLIAAVEAAGLTSTLSDGGPYTLFAPSDAAFDALPAGTVETLLMPENLGKLADILTYHVIKGSVQSGEVVANESLQSVFGQPLTVSAGDSVMIGNQFSTAKVVDPDIITGNGVIHEIDTVMLPMDIVDLAASAGIFNTLLAAAGAAGLEGILRGDGPLTVFAPTDEAFAALPAGTVDSLLLPENKDTLVDILTYHVKTGAVTSDDLAGISTLTMVNGDSASITLMGDTAKIDTAMILQKDLVASNGFIHVINQVILPPVN